jgi:hypothetical protein
LRLDEPTLPAQFIGQTCGIFAYSSSACSKCHELLNHEAPQSNYCACLSAAGDKAELMYSAFADVKMPQFISFLLVPNMIRIALSDICQKAS